MMHFFVQHKNNGISNYPGATCKSTLDVERAKGDEEPTSLQYLITRKARAMIPRCVAGCVTLSQNAAMDK
jgi:hypothetical protein